MNTNNNNNNMRGDKRKQPSQAERKEEDEQRQQQKESLFKRRKHEGKEAEERELEDDEVESIYLKTRPSVKGALDYLLKLKKAYQVRPDLEVELSRGIDLVLQGLIDKDKLQGTLKEQRLWFDKWARIQLEHLFTSLDYCNMRDFFRKDDVELTKEEYYFFKDRRNTKEQWRINDFVSAIPDEELNWDKETDTEAKRLAMIVPKFLALAWLKENLKKDIRRHATGDKTTSTLDPLFDHLQEEFEKTYTCSKANVQFALEFLLSLRKAYQVRPDLKDALSLGIDLVLQGLIDGYELRGSLAEQRLWFDKWAQHVFDNDTCVFDYDNTIALFSKDKDELTEEELGMFKEIKAKDERRWHYRQYVMALPVEELHEPEEMREAMKVTKSFALAWLKDNLERDAKKRPKKYAPLGPLLAHLQQQPTEPDVPHSEPETKDTYSSIIFLAQCPDDFRVLYVPNSIITREQRQLLEECQGHVLDKAEEPKAKAIDELIGSDESPYAAYVAVKGISPRHSFSGFITKTYMLSIDE